MGREREPDPPSSANPGFALGQLARCLKAAGAAEAAGDPEARTRAESRAASWVASFEGMVRGTLRVGSRTPVAGVPAWATPEVLAGGFVSGKLLAEGPLMGHEEAALARLGPGDEGRERARLNAWYLGDEGMAELADRLRTGAYRIEVPEEGALLVVAWLAGRGEAGAARELLDALGPWLECLRFYPVPEAAGDLSPGLLRYQPLAQGLAALEAVRDRPTWLAQSETLSAWRPFEDEVVGLFLETVAGDAPRVARDPAGLPRRRASGTLEVEGGWPCQRYPEGWAARALKVHRDFEDCREHLTAAKRARAEGGSLPRLMAALGQAAREPQRLSGRTVAQVRDLLAAILAKRGAPGSPRREQVRARWAFQRAAPGLGFLASRLAARLRAAPPRGEPGERERLLAPIPPDPDRGVRRAREVPPHLAAKVLRTIPAPVETLVERGVVGSAETLARLLPGLAAAQGAAAFEDPAAGRLFAGLYEAFRRRRSLLLLDLEHQVRLGELPWVRALERFRRDGEPERTAAGAALGRAAGLALTGFPATPLPNRLVGELGALARAAGLDLPLTEELAADIFMGTFTAKFLRAAQGAAARLAGSLYARYYGLPVAALEGLRPDPAPARGAPTASAFAALARERAGPPGSGRVSPVAVNGTVIEAAQVLTTHNLAALLAVPGLEVLLAPRAEGLARAVFLAVGRRLRMKIEGRGPRLRRAKDCAQAWRQLVFFLSLTAPKTQEAFCRWAREALGREAAWSAAAVLPALRGLERAVRGEPPAVPGAPPGSAPFLGWATGPHWLADPG